MHTSFVRPRCPLLVSHALELLFWLVAAFIKNNKAILQFAGPTRSHVSRRPSPSSGPGCGYLGPGGRPSPSPASPSGIVPNLKAYRKCCVKCKMKCSHFKVEIHPSLEPRYQPVPKAYRKCCIKFRSTPTLRSGLILV